MSSSSSSPPEDYKNLTLKLLINKTTNKVVYAETTKPVIDFLFHSLLLPISTFLNPTAGSLFNLYNSVQHFSPDLLQSPTTKQSLLTPKSTEQEPPISAGVVFFTCSDPTSKAHRTLTGGRSWPVTDSKGAAACLHCGGLMTEKVDLRYIEAPAMAKRGGKVGEDGYVKPYVNYMVTDELVVKALTTKDVLKLLLDNSDVSEMDFLKEKVVNLDINQGKALLNAALISKTVLTDTFLSQAMVESSASQHPPPKSSKKLDKSIGSYNKKVIFGRST